MSGQGRAQEVLTVASFGCEMGVVAETEKCGAAETRPW